ncbi:MAG: endo-1,4-beta-xylanase [Flavisolibacter sp.]
MSKKILFAFSIVLTAFFLVNCSNTKKAASTTSKQPSLKETFKNDFLIGTALSAQQIEGKDSGAARLVPQQFNAATPENVMKAEVIHPGWDSYNFDLADKLVAYAKKNNIEVTAHTLIWHSQTPAFLRGIKSADSIKQYFVNHINTVASRYDGKVYSWDVVNEALNEDGTMRNSIFFQKLGDDYIVDAFRLAQKAAPHTRLYYNDYNIEQPKKRAGAMSIIKKIQAEGVRIDGVGIQGHWHVDNVPMKEIEESLKEFSALGVKVAFTELDLSVLPNPRGRVNSADINQTAEYNAQINPYTKGLPDSMQQKLATAYADLFTLFLKYKDAISRVTFWGVNDGQSWLNGFPVRGRTNYPLLFDRQYNPKPAFYKVIETKTKGTMAAK